MISEKEAHERFKDHVLTSSMAASHMGDIITMQWGKPKSSVDYIVYVILPTGTLAVYGDLGSAVYQWNWSNRLSLEWLASLDLDYFRSKCEAFECGPGWRIGFDWDENHAVSRLQERLDSALEDTSVNPGDDIDGEAGPERCSVREFLHHHDADMGAMVSYDAWIEFMGTINRQGAEIPTKVGLNSKLDGGLRRHKQGTFPPNPKLNLEEDAGIGLIPAYRLQLHRWGLKLAYEWEKREAARIAQE